MQKRGCEVMQVWGLVWLCGVIQVCNFDPHEVQRTDEAVLERGGVFGGKMCTRPKVEGKSGGNIGDHTL